MGLLVAAAFLPVVFILTPSALSTFQSQQRAVTQADACTTGATGTFVRVKLVSMSPVASGAAASDCYGGHRRNASLTTSIAKLHSDR